MPVLEAVFQPANKAVFICKGSDPDRDAGRVFSDIHVEEAAARAWLARQ
jgi:hypothetical protein